jgi:purine catabolism regulator
MLVSLPADAMFDDAAVVSFVRSLVDAADVERVTVSVGCAAEGIDAALASVHEAADLAGGKARRRAGRGPFLRRAENRPLVQLVTALRDDHRVLEHGERMLAPLIAHDLSRSGDLLDVLEAMLAHPGNRTAAAGASHLSRSVFYQRIALIEELLGADLDDGETQTALHLALLVRRSAGR